MKISKISALLLTLSIGIAPVMTGCTPKVGGSDYAVSGAQGAYDVLYGTVEGVRMVKINNDQSSNAAVGTAGGAVIGGVLGNLFGGGSGKTVATVAGALAGAAIGGAGTQAIGNQTGVEVTIRLDSGRVMAVVQGADMAFAPGQRVKILQGEGTTRVVPQ